MRHFVIAGILVILGAILTYVGLTSIGLMPVEASVQSISIDWLWNLEIITISFLFALIVVPLRSRGLYTIMEQASRELLATLNANLGAVIRQYVAEAIEKQLGVRPTGDPRA